MKNKIFGMACLLVATSAICLAADVKVTPMPADEAPCFLKRIHRMVYAYDPENTPVITFYDDNREVVKQYSVKSPTKVTFEPAEEQAITNLTDGNSLSFYPNPSNDIVYINGLEEPTRAEIFNLSGRKLLTELTTGTINVSNLPAGTYVLYINKQVFKLLIQ